MTVFELRQAYGGLAPETRFNLIREHQHAPFATVSPVTDSTRGYSIPLELLKEVE